MQLAGKGVRSTPAVTQKRLQPCRASAASFAWPEGQRQLLHQQRRFMTGASNDEQYDLQPLIAWFGRRLRPRTSSSTQQLSGAAAQQLRPIEREAVLQVSNQQGGGLNRGGADWQRELNEPLLPKRPADPVPDPNLASSALTNDPTGLRETVDITDIGDRGSGPGGRGGYDDRFGGSGGGRGGSGGGRGRDGDDFDDGNRGGGMSPFTWLLFGTAVAAGVWYLLNRTPAEKQQTPIGTYEGPSKEQIREAVHHKVDDVKHSMADAGEKVKAATERAGDKVKHGLQETTRKATESLPPETREKVEEAAETGRKYWREIGTALLWIVGIGLLSSVEGPKKDKKKKPAYTPTVIETPTATTVITPTTTTAATPYRAPIAPPATVPAGVSTAPVTKSTTPVVSTATVTKPAVKDASTATVTKPATIKDADVTAVVTPVRSAAAVKTAPATAPAEVHTTGMHGADAVMQTTVHSKTVTTAGDKPGAHVTRP